MRLQARAQAYALRLASIAGRMHRRCGDVHYAPREDVTHYARDVSHSGFVKLAVRLQWIEISSSMIVMKAEHLLTRKGPIVAARLWNLTEMPSWMCTAGLLFLNVEWLMQSTRFTEWSQLPGHHHGAESLIYAPCVSSVMQYGGAVWRLASIGEALGQIAPCTALAYREQSRDELLARLMTLLCLPSAIRARRDETRRAKTRREGNRLDDTRRDQTSPDESRCDETRRDEMRRDQTRPDTRPD